MMSCLLENVLCFLYTRNILENKDIKHAIQISGFCNIMATRNKEEIECQEDDSIYSYLSK